MTFLLELEMHGHRKIKIPKPKDEVNLSQDGYFSVEKYTIR
jgi:hypothetical protein